MIAEILLQGLYDYVPRVAELNDLVCHLLVYFFIKVWQDNARQTLVNRFHGCDTLHL